MPPRTPQAAIALAAAVVFSAFHARRVSRNVPALTVGGTRAAIANAAMLAFAAGAVWHAATLAAGGRARAAFIASALYSFAGLTAGVAFQKWILPRPCEFRLWDAFIDVPMLFASLAASLAGWAAAVGGRPAAAVALGPLAGDFLYHVFEIAAIFLR